MENDDESMIISSEPATPEPMGTSNNTPRSSPFMLDNMDNFDSIDTFFDVESNMIACNYLVSSYPTNRSNDGTSRHDANLNLNLLAQQHSSSSSNELNVIKRDDEESNTDMEHFMDSENLHTPDDALFTFNDAFDLFDFDHLVDDHFGNAEDNTPNDMNTNHAHNQTRTNLNDHTHYYGNTIDKTQDKTSSSSTTTSVVTSTTTLNHVLLSDHKSDLSLPDPFSLIAPSPRHDHTLHPSSASTTSSRHRRGRSAVAHSEHSGRAMLDENGNVFASVSFNNRNGDDDDNVDLCLDRDRHVCAKSNSDETLLESGGWCYKQSIRPG